MSDDFGRDHQGDDPFVDSLDPDAVARAERRREREEKRASKAAKKAPKEPAAPPPPKPAVPAKPRTPEQEFWDEPAEPEAPAAAQPPVPGQGPTDRPQPDPEKAKSGRRRLLGRRRDKAAAAGTAAAAAGGAAASSDAAAGAGSTGVSAPGAPGAAPSGPPTGEAPLPKGDPVGPPTGEEPLPQDGPVAPPTSEAPLPKNGPVAPPMSEEPLPKDGSVGPSTAEEPLPKAADAKAASDAPATAETAVAKAPPPPPGESATSEQPTAKAAAAPTGGKAAVEPAGPPTAEQPMPIAPRQPDDEQPDSRAGKAAAAGAAAGALGAAAASGDAPPAPADAAGPSTREHRAPVPVPVEQTGAGDWEPPPPRDDDWFDTGEHFHDEGDPTMTGAARQGRRHGDDGGRRRGGIVGSFFRHPFRILGVIVLIIVLIFLNGLFQPFHGDGSGKVAVSIPKGSSVGEVGDLLEKKGVISGGTLFVSGSTMFQARVTLAGKRSDLFAGKFTMQKGMSYGDAIDQLSKEPKANAGTAKGGVLTVTIPEGQSRPITAKLLKEDGIKGSYMKATKKSKLLDPAEYGGKGAKDLEGFLFPDTWEYKTSKPVKNLVALQLQDFKKKIKQVNMKYAKSKNLTVFDVVTIASMIEREAGVPKQRKLVASVIYNRLHEGMTLGIDSTIRFATGNYEKPLTQTELESESPYNTRTHAGLPPGPINSPGLAALNAAAHPAKTDFLFYVNNPNSCNELTFAKTEEEFTVDAEKYEDAREKNGGNQPSTCK